jgi:hypothetical protein
MFSMFQGGDGKVSMMRVLTFITTVVILCTFIAHNVIAMIKGDCGFVSMGIQECALVAAALGLKAFQTKYENGAPAVEPPTTDAVPTDKKE